MLKKKYWLFFSLFLLEVFLFTSCLPFLPKPPVTEGILKGQVMVPEGSKQAKDLTGQALPDATVNIIDLATGDIIATTTTDANGYYQAFVPAGGPYLLQAVKDEVKIQQFTSQVEVGIEYDLGSADCSTTSVALIVQAMLEDDSYPDDPADINLTDIEADWYFAEVLNSVCDVLGAGGDPAESAVVQQVVKDFLHPPTPTPNPTVPPATLESIAITTPATKLSYSIGDVLDIAGLVVTGTYSDTTTKVETITTDNVTGFDSSVPAVDQVLTITVGGKTTTYTVTIVATPITAIAAISGTPQVGVQLTAGALTPVAATATATYQWRICDTVGGTYTNIAGATGTTYTPVAGDVTKFIKVVATGTGSYSGSVTSAATATVLPLVIGQSYGGGKVAYILVSGETIKDANGNVLYSYNASVQHGLIAATADQSAGIAWSNITGTSVGTTGIAIGDGQVNTTTIVKQNGCTSGAAYLCDHLEEGGYSDWFLPSKDELNKLYINQVAIGGFAGNYYWSSSEGDAINARYQYFLTGYQHYDIKYYNARVRAVRAF